nr:APH(3'') family aminoglycoside O-phosphotransferase [Nocardia vermiculata]
MGECLDFRKMLSGAGFGTEGWTAVTAGESGARVFHDDGAARYVKCVPAVEAAALRAERDRVGWLNEQGIPGARVLDWHSCDMGALLMTSAVRGVSADRLSSVDLRAAWGHIADAVRELHQLPLERCPFEHGLNSMIAMAREVVGRRAVNREFLPVEQQHTPPEVLLSRLESELTRMADREAADTVVCHGDLCLPNIVVDPRTLQVSGFIDLGRLEAADRHADLALLRATARETWADDAQATAADAVFAQRYGLAPDHDRMNFYLHLDPLTWG